MTQQNDFSIPDTNGQNRPSSQLDIYSEAIDSTVDDELLEDMNLGLGNYSNAEYWQQVESFKRGMYADQAFSRRLRERAKEVTKHELAINGWDYYDSQKSETRSKDGWEDLDDDERDEKDRRRYIEKRGERIWNGLTEEERYRALGHFTGFQSDWTPPHLRMMMVRHEASRSRGARLLDNLFGRVKEVKDETANLARELKK